MVEKESVAIATGEVSRERWYLLISLSAQQWGPKELLQVFRNHWSVENSLHHVKDRSWDEDVHTLRRPGLSGDEVVLGWSREEAMGNLCLGSREAVQERVGKFLAGLTSRKDEVRRRCRTVLCASYLGLGSGTPQ